MNRLEIMTKISLLLRECEENQCKSNCEHAPELRQYGEMLEENTRLARLEKYNGKEILSDSIRNQRIEKEKVLEMIEEGYTNREIIEYYETTEPVYYAFISKHKIVNSNTISKKYMTEIKEKIDRIKEFFEEGLTNKVIYTRMNMKKDTFYSFLRSHKLNNPNKERPGRKLF